jgi:hypothetical protein
MVYLDRMSKRFAMLGSWKARHAAIAAMIATIIAAGSPALAEGMLKDCTFKKGRTPKYYPGEEILRGRQGRVLLDVERTADGQVRTLGTLAEEPKGKFEYTAKAYLRAMVCPQLPETLRGKVSFTWTIEPGPKVQPFPEPDETIEFVGTILKRDTLMR